MQQTLGIDADSGELLVIRESGRFHYFAIRCGQPERPADTEPCMASVSAKMLCMIAIIWVATWELGHAHRHLGSYTLWGIGDTPMTHGKSDMLNCVCMHMHAKYVCAMHA